MTQGTKIQREFAADVLSIAMNMLPHSAPGGERAWTDEETRSFCDLVGPLAGRIDVDQAHAKIVAEVRRLQRRAEHWAKVAGWLTELAAERRTETAKADASPIADQWRSLAPETRARLTHWLLGRYKRSAADRFWAEGAATPFMVLDHRDPSDPQFVRVSRALRLAMIELPSLRRTWDAGSRSPEEREAERRGYWRWTQPYHGVREHENQWLEAEATHRMGEPWRSLMIKTMRKDGYDADAIAIATHGPSGKPAAHQPQLAAN